MALLNNRHRVTTATSSSYMYDTEFAREGISSLSSQGGPPLFKPGSTTTSSNTTSRGHNLAVNVEIQRDVATDNIPMNALAVSSK